MTGQKRNSSERRIADFISRHPGEGYDDLIREHDAEFFYHLSSLRRSLLSWFPFTATGSVLEVNGGFGTLTGLLSEKFTRVDTLEPNSLRAESLGRRYSDKNNIHILRKTIDQFDTSEKYDAVIYTDLSKSDNYAVSSLLEKLSTLIHDDGVILLGFSNRFGAKYQCGGLDHHVLSPFDTSLLYSKNELKKTLESRFAYVKWYYPMPDERFVQTVYTDRSDFSTISDRVFCFDGYNSPFLDDEKRRMLEYVQGGIITEHVNYYLAELRRKPVENTICDVYLSSDREEGRRYQVTIMEESVEKAPLDSQSAATLEESHRNILHLKKHRIHVIDEQRIGEKIIMPRIKYETLLSHLGNVSSRDEVILLFDRVYGNILRSSGVDEKNVLETGYIDMIPFNIFWNEGELLYYDQEFQVQNCDAAYIMFRALSYSWEHVPGLEEFVSLEEMKQRYSISKEKWEEYQQTETDFVNKNRSVQTYSQVYRWSYLPDKTIQTNRTKLLGYDPDKISEIHAVELDILKFFMKYCEDHDLSWFALHGTLLGAVRHGGFIPWDEDIDVGMRREDFDRLVSMFRNNAEQPYFLQTFKNDHWVFHGGYAKLIRENTAQIKPYEKNRPGHYGIGIDIFPLDYCEEDPEKFNRMQKLITHLQRMIFARLYPLSSGLISDADGRWVSWYFFLSNVIPTRIFLYILDKAFKKKNRSSQRAILACYYKAGINKNIYDDCDTENLTKLPFEDIEIPIIGNAEKYLAKRYGSNFLEMPTNRKTKNTGTIYDTNKSYTEYRGW